MPSVPSEGGPSGPGVEGTRKNKREAPLNGEISPTA